MQYDVTGETLPLTRQDHRLDFDVAAAPADGRYSCVDPREVPCVSGIMCDVTAPPGDSSVYPCSRVCWISRHGGTPRACRA